MARQSYSEAVVSAKTEEILEASLQVLEQHGNIDAVTLRRTASKMGCSYTALYRYFASKQELVTALRARAFRWMQSELEKPIRKDASEITNLEKLAVAYVESALKRPDLYQLMFFDIKDIDICPHTQALIAAKKDALDVCTQVMNRAQQAGEISPAIDALTASHLFWASAHGLASLEISNQLVMGRSIDELSKVIVDVIIGGLNRHEVSQKLSL